MDTESNSAVEVFRSVSVPLPQARAFELFTTRMTEFWPKEHSIGAAELAEVVIEPRSGGRWFERGVDGGECQWGRVAAWEPPQKVVLLWQIGADWQFDPEFETEVEVTFSEEGPAAPDWICGIATCSATVTTPTRCERSSTTPRAGPARWPDSSTSPARKPSRVTEAVIADAGHIHDADGVRGTRRLRRFSRWTVAGAVGAAELVRAMASARCRRPRDQL